MGAIGDLVSTIYDGQIQKIEEEQEANDEKYDKDVERIQNLADSGAISEEEAEARKRAAKERTEAKNAELEKQKQEMARKQAIWEKATSVAQAGIATALAITEVFTEYSFIYCYWCHGSNSGCNYSCNSYSFLCRRYSR